MTTVTLQFPDDVFSAIRRSPEEFGRELRRAAAILWYERGEVSQEKAAQVAGLSRTQFLMELSRTIGRFRRRLRGLATRAEPWLTGPRSTPLRSSSWPVPTSSIFSSSRALTSSSRHPSPTRSCREGPGDAAAGALRATTWMKIVEGAACPAGHPGLGSWRRRVVGSRMGAGAPGNGGDPRRPRCSALRCRGARSGERHARADTPREAAGADRRGAAGPRGYASYRHVPLRRGPQSSSLTGRRVAPPKPRPSRPLAFEVERLAQAGGHPRRRRRRSASMDSFATPRSNAWGSKGPPSWNRPRPSCSPARRYRDRGGPRFEASSVAGTDEVPSPSATGSSSPSSKHSVSDSVWPSASPAAQVLLTVKMSRAAAARGGRQRAERSLTRGGR